MIGQHQQVNTHKPPWYRLRSTNHLHFYMSAKTFYNYVFVYLHLFVSILWFASSLWFTPCIFTLLSELHSDPIKVNKTQMFSNCLFGSSSQVSFCTWPNHTDYLRIWTMVHSKHTKVNNTTVQASTPTPTSKWGPSNCGVKSHLNTTPNSLCMALESNSIDFFQFKKKKKKKNIQQ